MEKKLFEAFNSYYQEYDQNRRNFIPLYDTFYESVISLLDFDSSVPKILDLGAGTGLLSAFVLSKYPEAEITLVDQAEKMLDLAQRRFNNHCNIKYILGDYTTIKFPEKYDAVISALSIHHLESEQKKDLYEKSFSLLNLEGVFINADQVRSNFDSIENKIINQWHNFILGKDLSKEEIEAYYYRTSFDKTTSLEEQLKWLLNAGFKSADCIFKYLNFAVFFALKTKE